MVFHINGGVLMKNGRDRGIFYWKLSYKKKFIRNLWMIPLSVIVIIILFTYSELPIAFKIISTSALIVSLLVQLAYTFSKWKSEEKQNQT